MSQEFLARILEQKAHEVEQMELEFFCEPGTDEEWHQYWIDYRKAWYTDLGISEDNLRLYEPPAEKLSHYSKRTVDIQIPAKRKPGVNAGDRVRAAATIEKVALAAEVGDGERRPAVGYGDTDIVDEKGDFLYHRRLQPPEKLSWRSFRDGMLVCHQAFYARLDIAKKIPFDTRFRYSADIDWCIKIMREGEKEGLLLRNVHAVIANYLEEGQTTKHHRASLYERFQVMCRHYGILPTLAKHAWFVVRLFVKK